MEKRINFSLSDIKLSNQLIRSIIRSDAMQHFDCCYHGAESLRDIARKDYVEKYERDNFFTYNLCIYTWDKIWNSTFVYGSHIFIQLLKKMGLTSLVKGCSDIASKITYDIDAGNIRDLFADDVYLQCLEQLLNNEYAHDFVVQLASGVLRNKALTVSELLQLLKYPKRICIKDEFVKQASLEDFRRTEQRNRTLDRQPLPSWLLRGMRKLAQELFGDFTYVSPDFEELAHVGLPTGSTYFGMLTKWEKYALLINEYPELVTSSNFDSIEVSVPYRMLQKAFLGHPVSVPDADNGISQIKATKFSKTSTAFMVLNDSISDCIASEFDALHVSDGHWMRLRHRAARVTAVPKSYKDARIIAMEHPVNYLKQKHLAEALDRFFSKDRFHGAVNIHSQQHSVDLCYEAALTSYLVTIDHSHASDTVRKSIVRDILPQQMANAILSVVPDYILIGGELRPLSMLATSGCACTFNCEIVIFYLVARFAIEISGGTEADMNQIAVYGDDVIIPAFAAEAYVEIASRLGLIVNIDKTFTGDEALRYREACGAEFIGDAMTGDVYDAKCVYYPRRFLGGSITSVKAESFDGEFENDLTALVSLQHHLFNLNIDASDVVAHVIKQLYPKMTSSPIGAESADLWEIVPNYQTTNAPYDTRPILVEKARDQYGQVVIESVKPEPPVQALRTRQIHSMAVVNYDDPSRPTITISKNGNELSDEELSYRLFLFEGPEYVDGLMRLLRVSSRRRVHLFRKIPMVSWNERKI